MSTQINVTTTSGGQSLVNKVKTQQGATRLTYQDKESTKAEGERAKRRQRKSQTKPAEPGTRAATSGARTPQDESDDYVPVPFTDELAANRFGGPRIVGASIFYQPPLAGSIVNVGEKYTLTTYSVLKRRLETGSMSTPEEDEQIIYEVPFVVDFVPAVSDVYPGYQANPGSTGNGIPSVWDRYLYGVGTVRQNFALPIDKEHFIYIIAVKGITQPTAFYITQPAWDSFSESAPPVDFTSQPYAVETWAEYKAYVMSLTKIRELDTFPSELQAFIDELLPDPEFNTTYSEEFGAAGSTYTITVDDFSYDIYEPTRKYGEYDVNHRRLAQQFGIGTLTSEYQLYAGDELGNGRMETAAIYEYITGDLDLTSGDYSDMATKFFRPPFKFISIEPDIAPRAQLIPRSALLDLESPLDAEDYRQVRIKAPIIPTDDATSFFAANYYWDWGQPGYCRAQLLELGFEPADLRP